MKADAASRAGDSRIVSLALLPVLLCGYFGTFALGDERYTVQSGDVIRETYGVGLERGFCVAGSGRWNKWRRGSPPHTGFYKYVGNFGLPRWDHGGLLWHLTLAREWFKLPDFELSFPIWCPAICCLIAPALWVRRRRTRKVRGFAVEPRLVDADGESDAKIARNAEIAKENI